MSEKSESAFEGVMRDIFAEERRHLRLPASLRTRVTQRMPAGDGVERMGVLKPVLVGSAVLAISVAAIVSAALVLSRDSDSGTSLEPATVQEPGPNLPQVAEEPLVQDNGEYLSVRSRTVERGADALDAAVDIMPYPVYPPTYIPQGLRISHVAAQVTTDEVPLGNILTGYSLPTPADGTRRPYMGISWIGDGVGSEYPIIDHESRQGVRAGGYDWSTNLYHRRDGDTLEVVTTREDGVRIFVSLRLEGGLDETGALAELRKVVESMRPAQAE